MGPTIYVLHWRQYDYLFRAESWVQGRFQQHRIAHAPPVGGAVSACETSSRLHLQILSQRRAWKIKNIYENNLKWRQPNRNIEIDNVIFKTNSVLWKSIIKESKAGWIKESSTNWSIWLGQTKELPLPDQTRSFRMSVWSVGGSSEVWLQTNMSELFLF